MESEMTLGRAFREVADALESSDEESSVAVWPATDAGFVDEFQVLTEKEWQRLLRVGLRLSPRADLKELYCFQNIPAYDGLTVRVLRLAHESQIRTRRSDGTHEIWKVQKTPVVIRSRADVELQIARSENSESALADTPPRPASGTSPKSISPEEAQRKRRRSDVAAEALADELKDTGDELRPPKKTRRLSGKRKVRRAAVAPIRLADSHNKAVNIDIVDIAQRVNVSMLTRESSELTAGFVPVDEEKKSSSSACGDFSDKSESESTASDEAENDVGALEQDSVRAPSPVRRTGDILFGTEENAAAGMGSDEDASYTKRLNCSSPPRTQAAPQSASAINPFRPLWSMIEGASTQVHKVLTEFCGLSSVLKDITAEDAVDYDLLWVEEGDQQCWTMFGEPSTPGRIGVKTRRQQREQKRKGSKWKFW